MNEIEKGQLASRAVQCFTGIKGSLENFPGLMRKVIEEEAWKCRVHRGRKHELPNLRALITEKPVSGWGQDPEKIGALLSDKVINPTGEGLTEFRDAMKATNQHDLPDDNVTKHKQRVTGNSRAYSIDRVKRECDPATVEMVMSGQMSPNAALVNAGVRKNRQVYIPTDPAKCLDRIRQAFGDDYVEAALKAI